MYRLAINSEERSLDFRYERCLFNLPDHLNLNTPLQPLSLYFINELNHCFAESHWFDHGGQWRGTTKAPFAGFSGSKELAIEDIELFLNQCFQELQSRKNQEILFNQKLNYLQEGFQQKCHLLLTQLVNEFESDPHWVLNLKQSSIPNKLSGEYRRRMRRLKEMGFKLQQINGLDRVEAFKLLAKTRQQKQYSFSMSEGQFLRHLDYFDQQISIFVLANDEEWIAASLCFEVDSQVIYDFAHGHLIEWESLSPAVFLLLEIINHFKGREFKLIDLGASSPGGKIKESLASFKENLGAVAMDKFIFKIPAIA